MCLFCLMGELGITLSSTLSDNKHQTLWEQLHTVHFSFYCSFTIFFFYCSFIWLTQPLVLLLDSLPNELLCTTILPDIDDEKRLFDNKSGSIFELNEKGVWTERNFSKISQRFKIIKLLREQFSCHLCVTDPANTIHFNCVMKGVWLKFCFCLI